LDDTANPLTALPGVAPGAVQPVAMLTRAMVRGEEAAYRQFHESYCQRLYRYLLVVAGGNEGAAQEALQSTFVRVVRHMKAFEYEARFWNWLTVLARTAYLDQARKQRRYFAFLDRFTRHAHQEAAGSQNREADAQLLALLEQNLDALVPAERDLVERKYFQRQSVRDIAAAGQTTEKAVESQLSRVRQKLKAALLKQLKHEQAN
jgi:RNA polymerase sigma-70 factor (ECF subfamily)